MITFIEEILIAKLHFLCSVDFLFRVNLWILEIVIVQCYMLEQIPKVIVVPKFEISCLERASVLDGVYFQGAIASTENLLWRKL